MYTRVGLPVLSFRTILVRQHKDYRVQRSFSLVETKFAEADFFLTKLREAKLNYFAARCYFAAFIASARSITFAMQAVMAYEPKFNAWYTERQAQLRSHPVCCYFHHARRLDQHVGLNSLSNGNFDRNDSSEIRVVYRLAPADDGEGLPRPPEVDAITACHQYLETLLKIVFDCCVDFRLSINAKVWFSKDKFKEMGRTIGDAEQELFGVRGWTGAPGLSENARWQLIRNSVRSISSEESLVSLGEPTANH